MQTRIANKTTNPSSKQRDLTKIVLTLTSLVTGFIAWNIYNKKTEKQRHSKQLPHLVLHVDLNKTIIIHDGVSNLNVEGSLNTILAHRFHGKEVDISQELNESRKKKDIINNKEWIPNEQDTNTAASISYADFIKNNLSWLKHDGIQDENFEKRKNDYLKNFTNDGYSGAKYKYILSNFVSKLNASSGFILNQFWNMIHDLKSDKIYEMGYSRFSIVFRTFGTDIDRVIQEFNKECAAFKYDDLMIDMNDPLSHGIFIHTKDDIYLILGTLFVPQRYDTLKADMTVEKLLNIENMQRIQYLKEKYNVTIVKGYKEIHTFMQNEIYAKDKHIAIRDEFVFWGLNKRKSDCGKPFCLDDDESVHSIFFDDYADLIIDSRYIQQNGDNKCIPFCEIQDIHCVKCDPYEVLMDDNYFSNAIVRLNSKWKQYYNNAL